MFIGKALEKIRVLDRLHKVDERSAAVKELATQIAGNACLRCPQPSLPSNTLSQMRLEDHTIAEGYSTILRRSISNVPIAMLNWRSGLAHTFVSGWLSPAWR
jgi:hypothetical protein